MVDSIFLDATSGSTSGEGSSVYNMYRRWAIKFEQTFINQQHSTIKNIFFKTIRCFGEMDEQNHFKEHLSYRNGT